MSGGERQRPGVTLWLGIAGCGAVLYTCWRLLWFMTDDAYITYRYVANSLAGRGLVWNAEPFARVDGNTDFLWSMILRQVWAWFGSEPPAAANWLALAIGVATFAVVGRWAWRLASRPAIARHHTALVLLVLFGCASHRAWVAFLSSGLGAALFAGLLIGWAAAAAAPGARERTGRWFGIAVLAALCGLARPEGYLAVGATALLLAIWSAQRRAWGRGLGAIALAVLPIVAHVVWRRLYYGDWLPNTYYAKRSPPWPEAGWRYAACYVFEYAVWVWLPLAFAWLALQVRRGRVLARLLGNALGATAVAGVLLVHFAYYTVVIGGDLFEYRVYMHVFPFLLLSTIAMAADVRPRPGFVTGWLAAFVLLALPVGWAKFAVDDGPIAPHAPGFVQPLLRPYDAWQAWLKERTVCTRNHDMKENYGVLTAAMLTRAEGSRVTSEGNPVLLGIAVGLPGWVLPNVAILDAFGLNDWVIAHTGPPSREQRIAGRMGYWSQIFADFDQDHDGRVSAEEFSVLIAVRDPELAKDRAALLATARGGLAVYDPDGDGFVTRDEITARSAIGGDPQMAHDRFAPPGYREGFRENVVLERGKVTVTPRAVPLTDDEIRAHERHFRALLGGGS